MISLGTVYFYACAFMALAGAIGVVVSKNPIRGAMGLLLLILSVAGLFLALHAQFLAAIQLIVYAGAITILFLFVIMLLGPSASTPRDRRGLAARVFGAGLFGLAGLAALWLVSSGATASHHPMPMPPPEETFGGIDAFGSVLFADTLVPFELSSGLLMVAVLGAMAVARGRQGVKTMSRNELEVPRSVTAVDHPVRELLVHAAAPGAGGYSAEIHPKEGVRQTAVPTKGGVS